MFVFTTLCRAEDLWNIKEFQISQSKPLTITSSRSIYFYSPKAISVEGKTKDSKTVKKDNVFAVTCSKEENSCTWKITTSETKEFKLEAYPFILVDTEEKRGTDFVEHSIEKTNMIIGNYDGQAYAYHKNDANGYKKLIQHYFLFNPNGETVTVNDGKESANYVFENKDSVNGRENSLVVKVIPSGQPEEAKFKLVVKGKGDKKSIKNMAFRLSPYTIYSLTDNFDEIPSMTDSSNSDFGGAKGDDDDGGLSGGAIAAIIIVVLIVVAVAAFCVWYFLLRKKDDKKSSSSSK